MRIVEILSAGLIFFVVIVDRVQSVALWKNDFIEQLSAMHDEIDGIFCTNKPSYPPDNCKQTGSFVQCKLKNLNEASRKNMIKELWEVSKGIIRLLETVDVRTTEEIFQRGDILGYSGTLGHSEREIFENLLQTYDMAVTLSDSWDGKYSWHFDQLLVREMDFTMTVSGMAGLDFLRNFYDKNFGWCKALNLLKENQKKNCRSCTEDSLNDRLNDIYTYLAVAEVKTFICDIFLSVIRSTLSDENVIPDFQKIMRDSMLRTRDYMEAKEVLKKNLPPKKSLLNTGHKAKKTTQNPHVPARSKNANYTALVNNNTETRIVRKPNIAADISFWKQNFIEKLSQIYKKIDGTWCENEPSYIRGVCDSILRINQCVLKNNDRVSQKNTNLAMKNILQQWTNLLNEMSTFTSRKIDKYADIFKSIGLFEMAHYEKIDEICNAASDLINSWNDELERWKFQSLIALTQNFFYETRLQIMEFSDEIFHTSFHRCNRKNLLEQKLRTYCKSKLTSCSDELIKNQLYDIVEYLATIETKIFFSWTAHQVVQSMVIGDIFRTPNNHISMVSQLMENKNESFLRIKDYLNEIDDGYVTPPACEHCSYP